MPDFNPYSPPASSSEAQPSANLATGGVTRRGDRLVMRLDARGRPRALPERCVHCGQTDGLRLETRKLVWHPRWVFLLLLLNVLFFIIGVLSTRKIIELAIPMCREHAERRAFRKQLGVGVGVLGAALFLGGAGLLLTDTTDLGLWLLLFSLLPMLVGTVFAQQAHSLLRPVLINLTHAEFTGADERYLRELTQG